VKKKGKKKRIENRLSTDVNLNQKEPEASGNRNMKRK
jgi:hypothetical protein